MENQIFTGKTVEDAINAGLKTLGLTREEVEITVLEEGKRKLFGSIPAKVQLAEKVKLTDGERAVEFLKGLFEYLPVDAVPVLVGEGEKVEINLDAEKTQALIGRRGEVIDAIQVLAGAVANIGRDDYMRVVVDCQNYRAEREETLRRVANKLADKAVRLGKKMRLEPMNPYERRIIHAALIENDQVTTKSEGKEPARFVVIIPKNMKTYEKRDRFNGKKGGKNERGSRGHSDRKYGERKTYPKRELPQEETPQSSGTSLHREGGSTYKKGGFNGFFGTFLGNSRESGETTTQETEE